MRGNACFSVIREGVDGTEGRAAGIVTSDRGRTLLDVEGGAKGLGVDASEEWDFRVTDRARSKEKGRAMVERLDLGPRSFAAVPVAGPVNDRCGSVAGGTGAAACETTEDLRLPRDVDARDDALLERGDWVACRDDARDEELFASAMRPLEPLDSGRICLALCGLALAGGKRSTSSV